MEKALVNFTLSFANWSNSTQDWAIYKFDEFQLQPYHIHSVVYTINKKDVLQIIVYTKRGFPYADLNYNSSTQLWSINSNTPNKWELVQRNNTVTLMCY